MTGPSVDDIRAWLADPEQWPNDSYDIDSLVPSATQARRDAALKPLLPTWFWRGEKDASVLSIGSGKGYFERRYWSAFDRIYIVDPSDYTRRSLDYFPIPNAEFLGRSLFDVSPNRVTAIKYGWLGACSHYLFGEFYSWSFLLKLAMIIQDSVVIDAGIFDADTRHGSVLQDSWQGEELFEVFRLSQFHYDAFRESLGQIWAIADERSTPWIDGRRTLILRRVLPPVIQKEDLGRLDMVKNGPHASVYRTSEGYFKETRQLSQLLIYDAVSKTMGWDELLRWQVYESDRFAGFVTQDCGDQSPDDVTVSERLYLGLTSWLFPLGLLPADVARQNVRVRDGEPIWVDIDLRALDEIDARTALWLSTNIYKQYDEIPPYVRNLARELRFGYAPDDRRPAEAPLSPTHCDSDASHGRPAWAAALQGLEESVRQLDERINTLDDRLSLHADDTAVHSDGTQPSAPWPPEQSAQLDTLRDQVHSLRDDLEYVMLMQHLQRVVRTTLPKGSTVAVVSKGDDALLQLPDVEAWHFPRSGDGGYAGYYPTDSVEAIQHVEALRRQGGDYLLFPKTAFWWLEHYASFSQYLSAHFPLLVHGDDCLIYDLRFKHPNHPGSPDNRDAEADGSRVAGAPPNLSWDRASEAIRGYASKGTHNDQVRQLLADILPRYVATVPRASYFPALEMRGVHVLPVHHYSPVPDTRTLSSKDWQRPSGLPGLDMNEERQIYLVRDIFPRFQAEYDLLPSSRTETPHQFYLGNGLFGGTDALALYCMVRHLQPNRIVEIGSGFSSRLSAQAALLNGHTKLTCIEPFPDDILKSGFPGLTELIPAMVQDVGAEIFDELGPGDILFIDSSHVSKIDSDVNYLFLEIIPKLRQDVVVHVHDIFFPFDYSMDWVKEHCRFWNEQYLLQAFLAFNHAYEVLLSNSYMGWRHRDLMKQTFPNSPWWGGGSFWMRRVGGGMTVGDRS